jgi:hypothetical protein
VSVRRKARPDDDGVPKSKALQDRSRLKPPRWVGQCATRRGKSKRQYRTEAQARNAAVGLMLSGTEDGRHPLYTIRTYRCAVCSYWHVGHDVSRLKK